MTRPSKPEDLPSFFAGHPVLRDPSPLHPGKRHFSTTRPEVCNLLLAVVLLGILLGRGVSWAGSIVGDTGYVVDQWQTEDGLPQNSVTSIAQTQSGYLWLGTFNGLVRFDGARFTVFDVATTPELVSSRTVRLLADKRGRLWINSEFGDLTLLEGDRFKAMGPQVGRIDYMVEDSSGEIWLQRKTFLERFGGQERIDLNPDDGTGFGWVRDVAAGPGGKFYANRKFATGVSENKQFVFTRGPFGTSQVADQIYPSRDGSLWAGIRGEGLTRFRDGRKVLSQSLPVGDAEIKTFREDSAGNLWIGTIASGVLRYDTNGHWLAFNTGNGLSHDSIRAIFEDHEGNIWVGTDGGGLNRLKIACFRMRATGMGVALSVSEDSQGKMCVGFNGDGIKHEERGTFASMTCPPLFWDKLAVFSVFADPAGGVWTGDLFGGLVRMQDGRCQRYPFQGEKPPTYLRGLYRDRAGNLWGGHLLGLLRLSGGEVKPFAGTLPCQDVRWFTEDGAGRLIAGFHGSGIGRLEQGQFKVFGKSAGLVNDNVWSLYGDRQGAVWVGTFGAGLSRFYQDKFFNFNQALPAKVVTCILEDDLGYLWLGTLKGIFRVSRAALNGFAEGKLKTFSYQQYDKSDGLSSAECSGGLQPAACKTKDGRLWFATLKGVAEMDPAKLPLNPHPPRIVIEEALIDDKAFPMGEGQAARVQPGASRLEFRYTALSFTSAEKIRFKYQLEGLDKDWIDAAGRRSAPYMNVPPGGYKFRVIACNNDGVWNEAGTALSVVVLPFFWQTGWFRVVSVLGGVSTVLALFRRKITRLKQQREAQQEISRRLIESQEQERKRIAGELHDSLGQNLQLIKNRLMGLNSQRVEPELNKELREIAGITSEAISEMRAISYALRPVELEQVGLTRSVAWLVQKVADASKIRCSSEIDDVDGVLRPEMEMNFYRILQESLNNAVKHSQAAEVIVEIKKQSSELRLSVFDDGCGIAEDNGSRNDPRRLGLGMASMSERAKILGGTLEVRSALGKGTRITLTLPLPEKISESNKDGV